MGFCSNIGPYKLKGLFMNNEFVVNGKPAIRIIATHLKTSGGAALLDCEGDVEWFPLSTIEIEKDKGTVLVQEWILNQKFPNG